MILALLVPIALHLATPQQPDSTRAVSGRWQLDARDSDDPRARMRAERDSGGTVSARGAGGRRGGGGGGGGFGGGGRMGGRGGMGGDRAGGQSWQDRAAAQNLIALAFRSPAMLDLTETGDSLQLIGAAADTLTLPTNGHKVERAGEANVKVEYRARYRDGRLEVESKIGGAGKVTETYYLSPDRRQLFVLVQVVPARGGAAVTYRRVYDRQEPRI